MSTHRFAGATTLLSRVILAAALTAVATTVVPPVGTASATYPGSNGTIAFERAGDIWLVNPDGSGERNLTATGSLYEKNPSIAPDGAWVAFEAGTTDPVIQPEIHVMRLDGTGRRVVALPIGNLYEARNPTWSPDGVYLAFDGYQSDEEKQSIWVVPFDGDGTQLLQLTSGAASQEPSWSVDNEIVFVKPGSGLYAIDPFTEVERFVYQGHPFNFVHPDWSPDGSSVVFGCNVSADLCMVDADGSNFRQLTYPGLCCGGSAPQRNATKPAFSPDGSKIVFAGDHPDASSSTYHLHTIPASGFTTDNGGSTQVTNAVTADNSPSWGPSPGTGIPPIDGGEPPPSEPPPSEPPPSEPPPSEPPPSEPPPSEPPPSEPPPDNPSRLSGTSRYDTAVAIARSEFPSGAQVVYVARADNVVDAVAGGVLTGGPILLVPQCGAVPSSVLDAVTDLDPALVIALGGEGAICTATLNQTAAAAAASTRRLAGSSRFDTAVKIAMEQFPNGSEITYLARADNVVDAVAGGVLTTGPILLVPQCGALPAPVLAALDAMDSSKVIALGGPGAICDQTLAEAASRSGASSDRLAGESRFDTAVSIALYQFPQAARVVYLARADNVVDAVAGGVLTRGPILLVPQCGALPASVVRTLQVYGPTTVIALGGTGAVCDQTLNDAADTAS